MLNLITKVKNEPLLKLRQSYREKVFVVIYRSWTKKLKLNYKSNISVLNNFSTSL